MRCFFLVSFIFSVGLCSAQNVILAENFNNGMPAGWTATATDNQTPNSGLPYDFSTPWILVQSGSSVDSSIVTTSYFENEAPAERWLILPEVSLTSFGNYLRFKSKSGDASFPDSLLVMISNNGNAPEDFTDTLAQFNAISVEWENFEVNISEKGWTDEDAFIAFKVFSTDGYLLYLDNISVTLDDPSSTPDISKEKIEIYPIPAKENLYINLNEKSEVKLLDSQGKKLLEQKDFKSGQIDISHLAKGVYFLMWNNNNGSHSQKILIQ